MTPTPQEVDAAIAWLDNYCRSFRGESCLDNGSDCGCMKAHRAVGVLRALSAAPAPPREPTSEMMLAGMEVQDREAGQDTAGVWRAMWDAAPQVAPAPPPDNRDALTKAAAMSRAAMKPYDHVFAAPSSPPKLDTMCGHGKTVEQECSECEAEFIGSGLKSLLLDEAQAAPSGDLTALQSILRAGLSHAEFLRAWPMVESLSAEVAERDQAIQLLTKRVAAHITERAAQAERVAALERDAARYRQALEWIQTDAVYKPSEEHNWLSQRYVQCAQNALAAQGGRNG